MKGPDKWHGSYHDGHVDHECQSSMNNEQFAMLDTLAWCAKYPGLLDRRALKYVCQKTRDVDGESQGGDPVQSVSEPSLVEGENSFVEKQKGYLGEH